MKCDFSFKHYREILNLFKKNGYKFCFFSEYPDFMRKKVWLRHDIDFSPEYALEFARFENKAKIHSTFFVRLPCPFYNVFDLFYLKIIREISNLGHQIGLHYEGNTSNEKMIEKEVKKQIQILKNYFPIKKIVSFHRPSKFILGKKFKSFINTYQPEFFKKIKYLSDSKKNWREGCVCQWLENNFPPKNFQILIHPVWWVIKERDPNLVLQIYLKEKFKYLDNQLHQDSQVYKKKIF